MSLLSPIELYSRHRVKLLKTNKETNKLFRSCWYHGICLVLNALQVTDPLSGNVEAFDTV